MLSLARSINSASRTAQLLAPARLLATAAKAETEPAEDAVEGRRRRMGRNLYEFAQTLPENGLGYDIRPATWRDKPGCYYTLTELKLKEFNDELRHGKAWGILTWEGKRANYITRIKTPSPLSVAWELYEATNTGKAGEKAK